MDEKILEQFKNYRILCVEDEEGIRKRLVNTLKYYFEDVIEASNGTRAKIDLPRVTSSVYSSSSPTGIPLAIVDVFT